MTRGPGALAPGPRRLQADCSAYIAFFISVFAVSVIIFDESADGAGAAAGAAVVSAAG